MKLTESEKTRLSDGLHHIYYSKSGGGEGSLVRLFQAAKKDPSLSKLVTQPRVLQWLQTQSIWLEHVGKHHQSQAPVRHYEVSQLNIEWGLCTYCTGTVVFY